MEKPSLLSEVICQVRTWLDKAAPVMMLILLGMFASLVAQLATVYNLPPTRATMQDAIINTALLAVTVFCMWVAFRYHTARVQRETEYDYDYRLRYKDRDHLLSIFGDAIVLSIGQAESYKQALDDYEKMVAKAGRASDLERRNILRNVLGTAENSQNAPQTPAATPTKRRNIEIVEADRPE